MNLMMAKTIWTMVARALILCLTATAASVVGFSSVSTTTDNITVEANYNEWPPLGYFMVVNCVASFYSLLPILLRSGSMLWRLVAALDLIISTLMVTAGTSCAVVLYVIKNGVPQSDCLPYDHFAPAFTRHVIGALSVSCLAISLQFVLCIYTYSYVLDPLLLSQAR